MFKIHITVSWQPDSVEKFKTLCKKASVKPILIDLDINKTKVHLMTSSVVKSNSMFDVSEHIRSVINVFEENDFTVIRTKVETDPKSKYAKFTTGDQYWEVHNKVTVYNSMVLAALRKYTALNHAYVSKNAFPSIGNKKIYMVTLRSHQGTYEDFKEKNLTFINSAKELGFDITSGKIEFATYDSNLGHDDDWINQSKIRKIEEFMKS